MTTTLQIIFPADYEVCEGHDWYQLAFFVDEWGEINYDKKLCRNCQLIALKN